jgi:hypothetical protein
MFSYGIETTLCGGKLAEFGRCSFIPGMTIQSAIHAGYFCEFNFRQTNISVVHVVVCGCN